MKPRRIISVLLAALLFAALPVSLASGERVSPFKAPAGYNETDYNNCVAFLEQSDEQGIKNGKKMSPDYDPLDPTTWGTYTDEDGIKHDCYRFEQAGGEKRLVEIKANNLGLVGIMDMSGCAELQEINCVQNRISGMTVEGCGELKILNFLENNVSEVDVSTNRKLADLGTADNPISELDISNNPLLHNLFVGGGMMQELDLSNNPLLPMLGIYAEGNGTVGYMYFDLGIAEILTLFPAAMPGATFEGWFTEDGQMVNDDQDYYMVPDPWMYDVLIARYSGGVAVMPGDVDADGAVTSSDALLTLRHALGLITLSEAQFFAADVDGDGAVTSVDTLLILRGAMGLA